MVIRRAPETELRARLNFFYWLRTQIELGRQKGIPPRAITATCFPLGQRWSWERFAADLAVMPEVYELESPSGREIHPWKYFFSLRFLRALCVKFCAHFQPARAATLDVAVGFYLVCALKNAKTSGMPVAITLSWSPPGTSLYV